MHPSIKITDNFLDEDIFNQIATVVRKDFYWHYLDRISYSRKREDDHHRKVETPEHDHFQFVCPIYDHYEPAHKAPWQLIQPIIQKINAKAWIRIKANLMTRADQHYVSGHHYDIQGISYEDTKTPWKNTTAVLYLNTCNGYTIFKDGTRCDSVANRFVEFDNDLLHSGVRQTDTKVRMLINFNYFQ